MRCALRICFIVGLVFCLPALADTVTLRNGTRIEGEIIGQDQTHIQIRLGNGRVQTVTKLEVQRVQYGVKIDPKVAAEEKKKRDADLKKQKEEAEQRKMKEEAEKKSADEKSKAEADKLQKERLKLEDAAAEKERIRKSRTMWSPVWRSALLPGWGMYYAEKKKPAIIYGTLFGVTFLNAFLARRQANADKLEYANTSKNSVLFLAAPVALPAVYFLDSQAKSKYQKSVQRYNTSFQLMSLVYLIQLGHSAVVGKALVSSTQTSGIDFPIQSAASKMSMELRFDFVL